MSENNSILLQRLLEQGKLSPREVSDIKRSTQSKRRSDHEESEQIELVGWFERTYPQYASILLHIPNGGFRKNRFEGYRFKRAGVKAGVSDLFLPVARSNFHGLWLEFKANKPNNAPLSKDQKAWIKNMLAQNYQATHAIGIREAKDVFTQYLNIL
jgi:hypothetical protein